MGPTGDDPQWSRSDPLPGPDDVPGARKLARSTTDKYVCGVAGGLGRYFGVDPMLFRVAFGVASLLGGIGLLAYWRCGCSCRPTTASRPGWSRSRVTTIVVIARCAIAAVSRAQAAGLPARPRAVRRRRRSRRSVLVLYRAFGGSDGEDPARHRARDARRCRAGRGARRGAGVGFVAAIGGGVAVAADLDRRRARPDRRRPARRAAMAHPPGHGARPAARRRLRRRPRSARRRRPARVPARRRRRPAPGVPVGVGQLDLDLRDWTARRTHRGQRSSVGIGEARVRVPDGVCVDDRRARSASARPTCPSAPDEGTDIDIDDRRAEPARDGCSSTRTSGRAPPDRRPLGAPAHEAWRVDRTLSSRPRAVALGALFLLDRTGRHRCPLRLRCPAVLAAIGPCCSRRGFLE